MFTQQVLGECRVFTLQAPSECRAFTQQVVGEKECREWCAVWVPAWQAQAGRASAKAGRGE